MPPVIIFDDKAELNLQEISIYYIRSVGKVVANKILLSLFEEIEKLAETPLLSKGAENLGRPYQE